MIQSFGFDSIDFLKYMLNKSVEFVLAEASLSVLKFNLPEIRRPPPQSNLPGTVVAAGKKLIYYSVRDLGICVGRKLTTSALVVSNSPLANTATTKTFITKLQNRAKALSMK